MKTAAIVLGLLASAAAAAEPVDPKRIQGALDRGADFLVRTQHPDGTWGSHDPRVAGYSQLGWPLTCVGGHHGVTNAVTAMSAAALLGKPRRSSAETQALKKAADYLLAHWKFGYDRVAQRDYKAAGWGYAYTLDFLCRLLRSPEGPPFADRIRKAVPELIQGLAASRFPDGGWGYYGSFDGSGSSFTTGTVLHALARAREAGFPVPRDLVADAAGLIERLEFPNGDFGYDSRFIGNPRGRWPNEWLGGGSRAVVGWSALFAEGRRRKADDLKKGLDLFLKTADYLEIGRKRMIPHRDAPHQISGYFFFYGYYYAAESALRLPPAEQGAYWPSLLDGVLRTQEENGSWWDTICYDYGDKWGTAFAMLTLEGFLVSQGSPGKDPR